MTDADWVRLHADLVSMFDESEDATSSARKLAERDVDYYHNKQWTQADAKKLRARNQPVLMKNRIRRKIRFLEGLEQQQRTAPKAKPVTPQHEEDAYTATAVLRNLCDVNRYDRKRSRVFQDIAAAGWGGYEISIEEKPDGNPRIIIRRCPWDRMFWDPHSQEPDFSDARFMGLVIWMDRSEAIRRYGADAAKVVDDTVSSVAAGDYPDKPNAFRWVQRSRRGDRVRIAQIWYRDLETNEWCFAEFTKGGILNHGVSPYADADGKADNPYAWGSANVDRDNARYGEIRSMIDLQDAINKMESKLVHLGSVRQTYSRDGSLGKDFDVKDMRQELAKPDGHVRLTANAEWGKDFGVIPTDDMARWTLQLLQIDSQEMDLEGPNASMMGKGQQGQSGRAIVAQQQGGAIEQTGLMDVIRDMDERAYRKLWNMVRQYWTAEDWVSVTDDMDNLKWVGVNEPITEPVIDPFTGQPVVDPQTGQPAMRVVIDPMTGQPAPKNPVSELDVDIIIDDAPQLGTLQDEEFGRMVELAKIVPAMQQLDAATWIAASNLRNKNDLIQRVKEQQEAMAQQQGGPSPQERAIAMQAELEQQRAREAGRIEAAKASADIVLQREKAQNQMMIERAKAANDIGLSHMKSQLASYPPPG